MSSILNTSRIPIKHGNLHHIMDWCRSLCVGEWYITDYLTVDELHNETNVYEFQFTDERDLMLFEMRWR